jgi:hypothetical protein
MTSINQYHRSWAIGMAITLCAMAFAGSFSDKYRNNTIAQTKLSVLEPNEATKVRLQGIVKGILAAWDKADVVCLGEDHGRKNDSDLRIALIEHPDFIRRVNVIIVEFANTNHQDILDRLALEGEDIPRDKLSLVWKDVGNPDLWESPIYEAFLRTVRRVNLKVPRNQRVRILGGDNSNERNRGRFIREAVSREILSKRLKGLAIYGAGHCECRGMGFPGELESQYPGKIWAAFNFYDVEEGRRVFGLGDEPKLIPITGTDKAKITAGKMFFTGRYNDPATLGDIANAIVYYGNAREVIVSPDKR